MRKFSCKEKPHDDRCLSIVMEDHPPTIDAGHHRVRDPRNIDSRLARHWAKVHRSVTNVFALVEDRKHFVVRFK
ncbi:MAG TPA: hypothetical protein VN638_02855 [Nitrospiraceae bacterium]|nr:hypothetical protein [Nitrospiraceae bacterium]